MIYEALLAPFVEFEFMRRALVGALALALAAGPIGVFLMLRRMSLTGDAMAHAILPGAAIGFLVSGLWLPALTLGGFVAGVASAPGVFLRHVRPELGPVGLGPASHPRERRGLLARGDW